MKQIIKGIHDNSVIIHKNIKQIKLFLSLYWQKKSYKLNNAQFKGPKGTSLSFIEQVFLWK